jgi:ribosomal protein S18 acetylase RimI-like enzyme
MNEADTLLPEHDGQSIVIELARPEDAEAIANIQKDTWLNTYPNETIGLTKEDILQKFDGEDGLGMSRRIEWFKRAIESIDDTHTLFVARLNENILGYIMSSPNNGQQRVGALYVLPETQGKGIGSKLLTEAINWYGREHDTYLHVASYNQNAIKFYERFGFERTGQEFEEPEEALNGKTIPETEMILRAKV